MEHDTPVLCINAVRYPLQPAVKSARDLKRELVKFIGYKQSPSRYSILQDFHAKCQLLLCTAPHELTEQEVGLIAGLGQIIDMDKYRELNPFVDHLVGRLVSRNTRSTRIYWFGNDAVVRHPTSTLPANILLAAPGDTIHAAYRNLAKDEIEWISIHIAPPLRPDKEVLEDPAAQAELKAHSIDKAPKGTWPKVTTKQKKKK